MVGFSLLILSAPSFIIAVIVDIIYQSQNKEKKTKLNKQKEKKPEMVIKKINFQKL